MAQKESQAGNFTNLLIFALIPYSGVLEWDRFKEIFNKYTRQHRKSLRTI